MHLMSALQQRLIFGSLDLINYSKLPAVIRNQSRDGISVGSSFIEPFSNDCRKPKPKRNQSNRALNFDSHSRKRLYVTKLYQHEQRGSVAKEWNFPPVILSFRSEFAVFRPKKPSLSRSPSEKHEWPLVSITWRHDEFPLTADHIYSGALLVPGPSVGTRFVIVDFVHSLCMAI